MNDRHLGLSELLTGTAFAVILYELVAGGRSPFDASISALAGAVIAANLLVRALLTGDLHTRKTSRTEYPVRYWLGVSGIAFIVLGMTFFFVMNAFGL